jgi:hypothetical protein
MLPPDLVEKLAQCATHDFVGPRDLWFGRLARFTTAVFVGLVFELPELRYELKLIAREWIPYFKYRILTPRERNIQAAKVLAFVGWILIVVGVGGERYSEVKVKDLDASIQECGEAKLRAATLEAGDAAKSAKTAHEEADSVKGIADEARADAKDALAKARAAQRELAHAEADAVKAQAAASKALSSADKAESHIADALQRAETAEREAAKLKERFADRSLSDKQAQSIATKIRPFAGQEFDVVTYWDLPEPFKIADRIAGIMASPLAGWKYVPITQASMLLGGVAGVQVWVHPAATESVKRAANALVSALNAEGITAYIKEQNPKNPIDLKIHLSVGTKE